MRAQEDMTLADMRVYKVDVTEQRNECPFLGARVDLVSLVFPHAAVDCVDKVVQDNRQYSVCSLFV